MLHHFTHNGSQTHRTVVLCLLAVTYLEYRTHIRIAVVVVFNAERVIFSRVQR